MENLSNNNAEKLCKTILVGLPAVGKTTLTEEMSRLVKESTDVEIEAVSSDFKFRAVRKDKDHPIIQKFMKDYHIAKEDFELIIKTNDFIKKYGEPCFRDLESAIIIDMLEKGEFDNKIPNLGGKAMLHPKTAKAFKDRGYQVVYLKADLKTIAAHIAKDFDAMLDGASITRSPVNGPISATLRENFPEIADTSTKEFMLNRIEKMRANYKQPIDRKKLKKEKILREKEKYQYMNMIKLRNKRALEIITGRHFLADDSYENVSDKSVFLKGELKDDIKSLCQIIGIQDISAKANENDTYTNSIRSIIPGISEVVPYTYDEKYNYQEIFDPIIEKELLNAPSSDNPRLVHMLGIPAAGKSTFYRQNKEQFKDYLFIGFDFIMEKIPQYHNDIKELGSVQAFKNWELPARIAGYELLRRAIEEKKNIFFDHGGTPVCHRELLSNIQKMGYHTTMYYIDCPVDIALQRAAEREKITKCHTPPQMIVDRCSLIKENLPVYKNLVNEFKQLKNR